MRWENNRDERMRQKTGERDRREQQWKQSSEVEYEKGVEAEGEQTDDKVRT